MKPITLALTPEEANNALVLFDVALRHPTDGGIKAMNAVKPIADKINLAVTEAQKPDEPA